MQRIQIFLLIATVAASGCATMNPYIQHSRDVSNANIEACRATDATDKALDYACRMVIRMEKARAEIVSTRSGLTAAIFPLVGIIGYNSARGINAPTSAALTAGGFAGYSAITTLAQPDRIRVYDNGLRSTYCAIGVYQTGLANAAPETAGRRTVKLEATRVRQLLAAYRLKVVTDPASSMELDTLENIVAGIEEWLASSSPNRSISTQLLAFTRTTVAKVNSQLTLTVPDNKQLVGDALSALQSGAGTKNTDSDALRAAIPPTGAPRGKTFSETEIEAIRSAVKNLVNLYEKIAEEAAGNSAQLNFTDCAYADVSGIGIKDSIERFMLGPGDSYTGATVTVARGTAFDATISGGVLPYTATVNIVTGGDKVEAVVVGGQLKITVPAKTGTVPKGTYQVIVNDATNRYSKSLQVDVPASP